jgi:hypothetical protein
MSFSAKADMDNVCAVTAGDLDAVLYEYIEENCQRNNIFSAMDISPSFQQILINDFCRFDREIVIVKDTVTCVLYSNKRRQYIEE